MYLIVIIQSHLCHWLIIIMICIYVFIVCKYHGYWRMDFFAEVIANVLIIDQ